MLPPMAMTLPLLMLFSSSNGSFSLITVESL
jgi:hypothetical protein